MRNFCNYCLHKKVFIFHIKNQLCWRQNSSLVVDLWLTSLINFGKFSYIFKCKYCLYFFSFFYIYIATLHFTPWSFSLFSVFSIHFYSNASFKLFPANISSSSPTLSSALSIWFLNSVICLRYRIYIWNKWQLWWRSPSLNLFSSFLTLCSWPRAS